MNFTNLLKNKNAFIIAEIGNNHEGSYKNALKLIDKASEAQVDAVKFQSFNVENFLSLEVDYSRIEKLKKFSLSYNEFKKLALYAKKKGLIFFSTPLDIQYVSLLNQIQPIFKIASGDNNYMDLIYKVLKFSKPTIISCGLINLEEILILYKKIKNKISSKKIAFMHCISSYPAEDDQLDLDKILEMKKILPNCLIGYSDHSIGIDACVYAASLGAKIIEKHFTLSHNFSDFRDHKLSANPEEMRDLVKKIRKIEIIRGSRNKKITKKEKNNAIALRRSIAACNNIKKGSFINREDLIMLRPGTGLSYSNYDFVIGKIAKIDIKKNQLIKKGLIK